MLRGPIEMRNGVLNVVATLGAMTSHRRGIDLGLTAAVLFWIVVWGGFMVGVGWFVLGVLPRLGRRGARAVQVGVEGFFPALVDAGGIDEDDLCVARGGDAKPRVAPGPARRGPGPTARCIRKGWLPCWPPIRPNTRPSPGPE